MNKYDYRKEIAIDIKEWINDNITLEDWEFRGDLEDYLYNELWADNSITGNGGNYYDNEYNCETYLSHNLEKAMIACEEFGVEMKTILTHLHSNDLARYLDCTIRCYLLGKVIYTVLDEIWKSE